MKKIISILCMIIAVQLVFAGVLSVKEVAKLSRKGNIIIVSARSHSDYASKHIKGAVNIYHKDLYKSDGIASMLKNTEEIAKIFGENGISIDSKIAIYDNGDNKLAGRLYWIFEYMGVQDVNILNGHVKSWMKGRKPVTKKATKITPVTFNAKVDATKLATMDFVKANLEKAIFVDARSADEFDGKDDDDQISREGHIPNAISFEFKNVINDDGTIKSKDEIATALKNVGITADKEIILYCATSVRAGIVYMALTSIMDFPKVRVYDGAYYEWESVAGNPVE